jgi:3-hydroxyisobutyrate dehydrogenase-like beta-hydroxyacid dehydrogenase
MARVTVFGAGAMGTAMAMHATRLGLDVAVWANPLLGAVLYAMLTGRAPLVSILANRA